MSSSSIAVAIQPDMPKPLSRPGTANALAENQVASLPATQSTLDVPQQNISAVSPQTVSAQDAARLQERVLAPFEELFRSKFDDARENIIQALFRLLQACGPMLRAGWPTILSILDTVVSDSTVCLVMCMDTMCVL